MKLFNNFSYRYVLDSGIAAPLTLFMLEVMYQFWIDLSF